MAISSAGLSLRSQEASAYNEGEAALADGRYAVAATAFDRALNVQPAFVRTHTAGATAGRP